MTIDLSELFKNLNCSRLQINTGLFIFNKSAISNLLTAFYINIYDQCNRSSMMATISQTKLSPFRLECYVCVHNTTTVRAVIPELLFLAVTD